MRRSQYLVKKDRRAGPDDPITLSGRQRQILELVAEGATDNEIAVQLHLSAKTISYYMEGIFVRLDARSRTHAVALALRQGILTGGSSSSERS
jgi:DNA-binding NarL/FixJ family response regulator